MDPSGAPGIPILRTKVSLPRPHPETTPRLALEARLRNALACKLVLISAPAGYGKTTLLARVLVESNYPVAWLSLDEHDNASVRFWGYLIAALQSVLPGVGETALALLNAPQAPPFELVLAELVNDLAKSWQELILVLDDLHEISSPEILEELAELIARTPPNLHLVLASRQLPDLPLARLRARRDLVEFTTADLRFQTPEIEHLFNQLFALDLSLADLGTLEKLTEGWIAGLQLAALVLRSPVPGALTVENLVESFQKGHQIDRLAEIEAEGQFGPIARSAALFGAELALRQGDLARAQAWLAGSGLQVDSPIELSSVEAMLMQARILLASRRDAEALRLAGRLLGILEEQGRMGQVLEVLLLQSILYERQGDDAAMNRAFGQALDLAEAEGYQRILIDLGADFALVARAYTGPHREYLNKLLASQIASIPPTEIFIGKAEKLRKAGMLSQREVEVLRLVAEGRTNQEIADHLFISLNTVKTHVRHIFQCLDVRNRAEAISLARVNQLI